MLFCGLINLHILYGFVDKINGLTVQLTFSCSCSCVMKWNSILVMYICLVYPVDVELKRESKNHFYLLTINWSDGSHTEVIKSLHQLRDFHGEVIKLYNFHCS